MLPTSAVNTSSHSAADQSPGGTSRRDQRRALVSSFLGSTVEMYDFILYASAAGLVFPHLFFPAEMDARLGMMLSFTILLSGYVVRPLGGIVFGHLGDKYGRKNILCITLVMMGVVSTLIGLLPTYAAIGAVAPIILVVLRVVQGLALGGEWAGATLMAAEHVSQRNRGLAASIAVTGGPSGAVLATLVLGLFAGLPQDQFFDWGWRVPFLLSAVLVIIGLYLRLRVSESPDFAKARDGGEIHQGAPIVRTLIGYPRQLLLAPLVVAAPMFMQSLLGTWMVPYVVASGAMSSREALMFLTLSNFLHIFAIPAVARISDRIGRRRTILIGAVISVSLIFPMFAMFNSGSAVLICLAFIVGNPIIQASMYGPVGAYLAEQFQTRDRYTGVSLTYQVGSLLGAGTAPLVATWLVGLGNSWGTTNIATYFILLVGLAAIATVLTTTSNESPEEEPISADQPMGASDSLA